MFDVLQVLTLILVVLAMVPALAHALELPGKLRLTKDAYFAVQPIYYPGFTIAGIGEPVAIISTIILLVLTPLGSVDLWLTLVRETFATVDAVKLSPAGATWVEGEHHQLDLGSVDDVLVQLDYDGRIDYLDTETS